MTGRKDREDTIQELNEQRQSGGRGEGMALSCCNVLIARDYKNPQSPSIPVVSNNRGLNTLVSYSSWLMLMAEPATDTILCSIKESMGNNSPDLHTACDTAGGLCRSPVNDHEIKSHTSFLPE